MFVIRDQTPRDVGQVRMINKAAFDQPDEARLAYHRVCWAP
jgi:predicted N-acetyltransferase YhbS